MKTLLWAYSIVWAVIFAYLVVNNMRLVKAEKEIENIKEALSRKKS